MMVYARRFDCRKIFRKAGLQYENVRMLRIVSRSSESFNDRQEAGRLLGSELKDYAGKKTVVLGVPRGGVIVASALTSVIGAELDIVLSRKLGAPGNPELAMGAIAEDGKVFLNENLLAYIGAGNNYIQEEKKHQLAEITRRVDLYRKVRPKVSLKGRIVIITDDGLATGATMQAAVLAVRQESPEKLIVAVPVAPGETLEKLESDADEILCLQAPAFFAAVGEFYKSFKQITDEEVLAVLREKGVS